MSTSQHSSHRRIWQLTMNDELHRLCRRHEYIHTCPPCCCGEPAPAEPTTPHLTSTGLEWLPCCRDAARKRFSCPTSDSKEQDTFVCFPAEEDPRVFELVSYSLYFQIHLFHKRLDSPQTKLKAPPDHDSTNAGPQGKERGRPSKSDILEQHPEPLLGCRKRSWLL